MFRFSRPLRAAAVGFALEVLSLSVSKSTDGTF
jgi:hypothetical protein